jgi:SAM-dependent methyltransferase
VNDIAPESRACPCCGARDWRLQWRSFIVCRQCGVMTLSRRFDIGELRRLYGEGYFHGEEYVDYLADRPAQERTLGEHLKVVRRHVAPGGRLLEIGCAYGYFLSLARADYPDSVGIDVAAEAVAAARAAGLDARVGDALEFPFQSEFDGVCLWDTIEHLPHPDAVIECAARALKPGGHLFLTTGDFGAWLPRIQGLGWRQIHPPTHVFYFTRASLRALCSRYGLEALSFSSQRVHRRVSSMLLALERTQPAGAVGKLAAWLARRLPARVLAMDLGLDLGDTLCLVARRR